MTQSNQNRGLTLPGGSASLASAALDAGAVTVLRALTDNGPEQGKSPSIIQNAVGALVGDWVGEIRTRRLIGLMTKTSRVAASNGIDPEKLQNIPNGERYRLLDAATRNDDPLVEDMWASLILSELEVGEQRERLVRILENMTGDDARVLTFIQCARSLGTSLETEAQAYEEILRRGFIGDEKKHFRRSNLEPYETVVEMNRDAIAADQKRKEITSQLKALEDEWIRSRDVYEARDALLRLGLIQIRITDIPDSVDNVISISAPAPRSHFHETEDIQTCDPEAVMTAIDCLHNLIAQHTGYNRLDCDVPELVDYKSRYNVCPWVLTPSGERLYEICALRADD